MTFPTQDPRRERGSAVPMAPLSLAEIGRIARFKRVYTVAADFGIDCLRDAERVLNCLEFMRWLHARGEWDVE